MSEETKGLQVTEADLPAVIPLGTPEIVERVKTFMDSKEKKVFFGGKRYPEFEDWQYVGGLYGLRAKTSDPEPVEIDEHKGFKARAVIIDKDLKEVGSAVAYCMDDEPNWRTKPIFQWASMAQTRAAAKAFSNIFRPVMRMAGYEGTPSEEMPAEEKPSIKTPQAKAPEPQADISTERISEKQQKLIFARCKAQGIDPVTELKPYLREAFKIEHTNELSWRDLDKVLLWITTYAPVGS